MNKVVATPGCLVVGKERKKKHEETEKTATEPFSRSTTREHGLGLALVSMAPFLESPEKPTLKVRS